MKRLILIFLLLPSLVYADGMVLKIGSEVATDSCTGGLLFSWHCENTNVTLGGIGGGVNNGCSLGDTTATAYSSAAINGDVTAQDGAYSLDIPTNYDYVTFAVSSDDIVSDAAGTVIFYLYINSYADNADILRVQFDTNNKFYIWMNVSGGYNRLEITYTGNSTTQTVNTTNTSNIATGSWVKVTGKWSTAGVGGKYLYISIDDADVGQETNAITALTSSPVIMYVGNLGSASADFAIDNIKIYDSWL